MQTTILECDGMQLVPFSQADFGQLEELDFFRCNGGCDQCSAGRVVEQADDIVRSALQTQEDLGFGRWKVLSSDDKLLGWVGFSQVTETSEISLSYCLPDSAGANSPEIAQRLCSVLSDWFFENTYFSHLVAVVRTDNRDTRNVMLDAGFYHRESKVIGGMQADVFQLFSPSMRSYLLSA